MRHLPLICFNFLATARPYFRPLCRIGHASPENRAGVWIGTFGTKQGFGCRRDARTGKNGEGASCIACRSEPRAGFVGAVWLSPPSSRCSRSPAIPPTRARGASVTTSSAITSCESYNPPYAAIVVDAKTGAVLHQANPGQPAPSGLADQDHDALPAVRAARGRQDQARHADAGVRSRPRRRRRPSSVSSRARPSRSRTPSRRWSPSPPTTPPSWWPKRSAAARTNSPA